MLLVSWISLSPVRRTRNLVLPVHSSEHLKKVTIYKFSTRGPRTCCRASLICRLLRFHHHLLAFSSAVHDGLGRPRSFFTVPSVHGHSDRNICCVALKTNGWKVSVSKHICLAKYATCNKLVLLLTFYRLNTWDLSDKERIQCDFSLVGHRWYLCLTLCFSCQSMGTPSFWSRRKSIVFFDSFREKFWNIQHGVLHFRFLLWVSFGRRGSNGWCTFVCW